MSQSKSPSLYKAPMVVGLLVAIATYVLTTMLFKWSAGGDAQVQAMVSQSLGNIVWVYTISVGVVAAIFTLIVVLILRAIRSGK